MLEHAADAVIYIKLEQNKFTSIAAEKTVSIIPFSPVRQLALLRLNATITLTQKIQRQTTLSLVHVSRKGSSRCPLWLYLIYVPVKLRWSHPALLLQCLYLKKQNPRPYSRIHPCLHCCRYLPNGSFMLRVFRPCSRCARLVVVQVTRTLLRLSRDPPTKQTILFLALVEVLNAAKANSRSSCVKILEG